MQKNKKTQKAIYVSTVLFSICSMIYLEVQNYGLEKTETFSTLLEDQRLEAFNLPDIEFIQNLISTLFNMI